MLTRDMTQKKLSKFLKSYIVKFSGAVYKFTKSRGHGGFLHGDNIALYLNLAYQFPGLKTLRSCGIFPASWAFVEWWWYPINRIPTSRTLKDLDAYFLTCYSFSTPKKGNRHNLPPVWYVQRTSMISQRSPHLFLEWLLIS